MLEYGRIVDCSIFAERAADESQKKYPWGSTIPDKHRHLTIMNSQNPLVFQIPVVLKNISVTSLQLPSSIDNDMSLPGSSKVHILNKT